MNEFIYKGHNYKVVPIEGSSDFTIVKDGRTSRRISKEIADNAIEYVERLFKD